ncbi:MAG: SDR family oxidoreductase [Candidatus Latescibacteria bacterium]|nr:SDR family oxidoreductase [Candidatus Latescibacterota bacterium]
MPRLRDKVAILTGAASGIGQGTAELFAEHGARLVLVDRDEAGLAETSARVKRTGALSTSVCGDVSQAATIQRTLAAALEAFGQIDVVFNNAGIMPYGDLQQVTEETWDEVQAVNVKAMFLMCKAVIPHMLKRRAGSIINTSSVMATLTEPGYEAYTTSKAGVIGLTKALAVSYAEQGIRVNALCPGWVDTPMNRKVAEDLGGLDKLYPIVKRQQPLGRMASTREVAYAVLFLASDESTAVTGSALYVDGASTASI